MPHGGFKEFPISLIKGYGDQFNLPLAHTW